MTDNTPMVPTDAELMDLGHECELDAIAFGRAVLTRWGQPAHSGEPVAWLDPWTGTKVTTDYDAYGKHGIPLYLAPQPVEREPLTDEAVDLLCKVGPVYVLDGKVTRTPAQYRDELKAAQRYGLRKGERAHGIKGGQHG